MLLECVKGEDLSLLNSSAKTEGVLATIPKERQHQKIKNQDLDMGDLPVKRALGIHWNTKNDYLGFNIKLKDKPLTMSGMLSTNSSVYDPLGIAAPFVLKGRQILQSLCQLKVGWDKKVPNNFQNEWIHWQSKLPRLENIQVATNQKILGVL